MIRSHEYSNRTFGVTLSPIADDLLSQLRQQGVNVKGRVRFVREIEKDAMSLYRLEARGVITENQSWQGLRRLWKDLERELGAT